MRRLSLELPKYRLNVSLRLVKRRKPLVAPDPLIPGTKQIRKYRSGHAVSRFFRYVFEHKNIKKVLGANLALIAVGTNLVGAKTPVDLGASVNPDPVVSISADKIQLLTEKSAQYPLKSLSVTQGFSIFHPGVDLDGNLGDPVYPIKPGRVDAIQSSKFAYGNAVLVDHGNQITSLYAHLSKIEVKEGQDVDLTTEIGKVGATGHATGTHLHLEVRDNGRPINPSTVLP